MPTKMQLALNPAGGTKCSLDLAAGTGDLTPFLSTEPRLVWAIYLHNSTGTPSAAESFVLRQGQTAAGAAVGQVGCDSVGGTSSYVFPKPVHFPAGMFLDRVGATGEAVAVMVLFETVDATVG